MTHCWEKEIVIDPYEGPYIVWHKIDSAELPPDWQDKLKDLEEQPSPDGQPWSWRR